MVTRAAVPVLLLAALVLPLAAQDTARAAPPAANPADVGSMDAILLALYDVISGPAGQARDWNRFRSLFAPGARLIPTRQRPAQPAEAAMLTVEDYVTRVGPMLERNGFFERELARRTESFGRITHAFSSYASFHTASDTAPFSRGINSIQLLDDGQRWWVVTVFWDAERPGLTIPPRYLQRPSDP